jgi:hypothetical protein
LTKKTRGKDAPDSTDDPMQEMRDRYDRATEADQPNRLPAIDDLRFLTVPGCQWDEAHKKNRRGRPCYEFPILRSHWRQVVNDQKQARPSIKVRAVGDEDAKGAELRQGLIRNIESVSNAAFAYDSAFELLSAAGFGAWRVKTQYNTDSGFDQDVVIEEITDPLTSVWFDPDAKKRDKSDAMYCFVEESMSRAAFKRRYPGAEAVNFEDAQQSGMDRWYGGDAIRIAEYWRKEPITKAICLLSDGRSIDGEQWAEIQAEEEQQGISCVRERKGDTFKVVVSIVAGKEEIEGPADFPADRIGIVPVYANLHFVDGKWTWCGMVRHSRDSQKLLNYNLTTATEVLAKQPKAPYLVTPKMMEGKGVKEAWDKANSLDTQYLPYTPDPLVPGGPIRLPPPQIASAFVEMAQIATDMLKASDGIYDESQGKQTNATSGKAILARQREGDVATFDYQDALAIGICATGEIILQMLPKVYDTPRVVRILGKDGGEDWIKLYEQEQDNRTGQTVTVNDLSAGKYDVTVSTGPSYSTQRAEFVDTMMQMFQQNPALMQIAGDLVVSAMDFPKAEEVGERIKMMLPPPIQQQLQAGKDQPPEVIQLQQAMQQQGQMAQQHIAEMQQEMQKLQAKASSKDDSILKQQIAAHQAGIDAKQLEIDAEQKQIDWYKAHTERLLVLQKDMHAEQARADAAAALDREIQQGNDGEPQPGVAQPLANAAPQASPAAASLPLKFHPYTGEAIEPPQPDQTPNILAGHMAAMTQHAEHTNAILRQLAKPKKTTVLRNAGGDIIGAQQE